ncbi:hypothetical protein PR048_003861 [Dryococelus australis]|uniref:Uncharacterized protein n=1 Tax=Dryococelus australis TaxID=614101 RepID=A0ABQ9IP71_9NEOP|nr:hypothetical protein PR048_003861 [Dryococelus australis]
MKDGMSQLKLSHNYMYKVQGVFHISRRKTCNFVVWTPEGTLFLKIQRDRDFWENKMVTKLLTFFYDSLLPEICLYVNPRLELTICSFTGKNAKSYATDASISALEGGSSPSSNVILRQKPFDFDVGIVIFVVQRYLTDKGPRWCSV